MNAPWLTILSLGLLLGCLPANSATPVKSLDTVRLTDSGNRVIYRFRYFNFENVNSLEQLLDQIPDLQHALDDSLRETDYRVLINGNVVGSAPRDLKNIGRQFSLADIKRIVILRGPIALEYAGVPGPAINITLKVAADRSVGRWEASTPLGHTRHAAPNVRLNYSDRPGDWAYEVFTAYLPNDENRLRTRREIYLDPQDLQPTQQRLTTYDENNEQYVLGGSLNWRLHERLNLRANSRLSERQKIRIQTRRTDDLQGAEKLSMTGLEDERRMSEFGLTALMQLTPTTIWETRLQRIEEKRDKTVTTGQVTTEDLQPSVTTRRQDLRMTFSSVVNWAAEHGSEFSLALYAGQRRRDALSAFSLAPLLLETEAEIIENRYNVVAQYGWKPLPGVAVFTSLDLENWHLKQQSGQFSRNDHRVFAKPAFDVRWKFADNSLLRLSSKRQVRSLNFDKLVFNFDLDDEIFDSGNLSMVPEKSWLSTLFIEQSVLDRKGKLRLGGFYRVIEDYIERVPTPLGGSEPGNIGDAYARGVQLTGRYKLFEKSNVPAVIKADFNLQNSAVTDPFTGEERPLRGVPDKILKLELRQEFLLASLDYVLDMTWRSDTYYSDHNYREIRSVSRPLVNLKLHYQASKKIQVWLEVRGMLDVDESRWREKFTGGSALGRVSRYEQSEFHQGRQFTVGLQGYF